MPMACCCCPMSTGCTTAIPDHPDAELLAEVRGVTDEIHAMADGGSGSGMGSGGMTSKLQAAEIAERAGIALAIINGTHEMPDRLARWQRQTGTLFLPKREDTARARPGSAGACASTAR